MADLLRVNLLPEESRKSSPTSIEQFHRTPIMWVAGVVLVALPLLLSIPIQVNRVRSRHLSTRLAELEPQRADVERMQRILQRLQAQETAFAGAARGRGLWSERLNILSDVTPEGVWFTDLTLDTAKGLVLQGAAVASSGPEMVTVTRLVQDLGSRPAFAEVFKQIQIGSIKRAQDGPIDLVQFTITCSLDGETG